jgi:hypothetical protein
VCVCVWVGGGGRGGGCSHCVRLHQLHHGHLPCTCGTTKSLERCLYTAPTCLCVLSVQPPVSPMAWYVAPCADTPPPFPLPCCTTGPVPRHLRHQRHLCALPAPVGSHVSTVRVWRRSLWAGGRGTCSSERAAQGLVGHSRDGAGCQCILFVGLVWRGLLAEGQQVLPAVLVKQWTLSWCTPKAGLVCVRGRGCL